MRERIIIFGRGLRILWKEECLPVVRGSVPIVRAILEFGKPLLILCWIFLPYCFLIAEMGNRKSVENLEPRWLLYLALAGVLSQGITGAVLFLRHTMRLGRDAK